MNNYALCKSCNARIYWCKTVKGSKMPIDPTPVQFGGNIVIRDDVVHVLKKDEPTLPDEKRYRAHFMTCASAKKHRKDKKAAERDAAKKAKEPPTLF